MKTGRLPARQKKKIYTELETNPMWDNPSVWRRRTEDHGDRTNVTSVSVPAAFFVPWPHAIPFPEAAILYTCAWVSTAPILILTIWMAETGIFTWYFCFSEFYKMKFNFFLQFWHWPCLAVKGVNRRQSRVMCNFYLLWFQGGYFKKSLFFLIGGMPQRSW